MITSIEETASKCQHVTITTDTGKVVVTAYDIAGNESDFSNKVCSEFVIKKQPSEILGI